MAEVFKNPRKRAYLNQDGAGKGLKSQIPSTFVKARGYRKQRLVDRPDRPKIGVGQLAW
jgi:hypothetical protein